MSPPLDPANPLLISKELLGSQEVSTMMMMMMMMIVMNLDDNYEFDVNDAGKMAIMMW